jgi:hypothetical protein
MKLRVFGFVHDTHAATAQLLQHAVVGNGATDHVDGTPTLGTESYATAEGESNRHRSDCLRRSQCQVLSTPERWPAYLLLSQAAARMSTTREVVMVW